MNRNPILFHDPGYVSHTPFSFSLNGITFIRVLHAVPDMYLSGFFLFPSFCHCLISSDPHCFLSGQLMWLLHGLSSCPGYLGWLSIFLAGLPSWGILKLGHCPAEKPSWFHYFTENEVGKHTFQVIFRDLCIKIFLHMACVLAKLYHCLPLTCTYFSVLLPFHPGLDAT